MKHWWIAILFVTTITAYAGAMWILLAFARHGHRRILIMLDSHYGWRDAGVLLKRRTRRDLGQYEPRHTEDHPAARAVPAVDTGAATETITVPAAQEPDSTVIVADLLASGAAEQTDPHGLRAVDQSHTATMTVPLATFLGERPEGLPPWAQADD